MHCKRDTFRNQRGLALPSEIVQQDTVVLAEELSLRRLPLSRHRHPVEECYRFVSIAFEVVEETDVVDLQLRHAIPSKVRFLYPEPAKLHLGYTGRASMRRTLDEVFEQFSRADE